MRGHDQVKLGDLAENLFRDWADRSDFTPNKAEKDRLGWDFIIQVRPDRIIGQPLDQSGSERTVFVQVKGTRKGKPIPVKLAHWKRAVDGDDPFFYMVVILNKSDQPVEVYLVHVGEEHVRQVLKRLRLLHAAGHVEDVHRRTLALKWSASDRVSPMDAAAFAGRIRGDIGQSRDKYRGLKSHVRDSAGYQEGRFRLRATFSAQLKVGEHHPLVEFVLGDREKIELDKLEVDDVRFDIAVSSYQSKPGDKLTLRWGEKRPGTTVKARLEGTSGTNGVELDAMLAIVSAVVPDVPREDDIVRVKSRYLTIDAFRRKFQINFGVEDLGELHELGELGGWAEVMLAFAEADRSGRLVLRSPSGKSGSLTIPADGLALEERVRHQLGTWVNALWLARKFGLHGCRVRPSMLVNRFGTTVVMRCAVDPLYHDVEINKASDDASSGLSLCAPGLVVEDATLVGIPILQALPLGDVAVVMWIAAQGRARVACEPDGRTSVRFKPRLQVVGHRAMPTSELGTIDKEALGDLVERQLQSDGVECVIRERVDSHS